MGKVNIDFTPTKYSADDAPDLVTGAYNQSMDDLKTALDNATAEDSGGGGDITYPIPVDKGGTNANNAADAANNLMVLSIGNRTEIPEESNLNEYKAIGNYACKSTEKARTIINTPWGDDVATLGAAFNLTVESTLGWSDSNYLRQIYKEITVTKRFERYSFDKGSTWSAWVKVATSIDLANYLPLTGGTLTGTVNTVMLNVGSYNDNIERTFSVRRGFNLDSDEPTQVQAMINVGSDQALFSFRGSDNSSKNYLQLLEDKTRLKNALAIDSGGTGANNAKDALENLGVFNLYKSVELTINIVDNEGEIDGHQIPKSEGTIIPLCVHGKHTATPVVFGFDVDEDDTNYLLYIYAQTKSQVDSITVVFEYLAF